MESPLISIIVPIYNVSEYLKKCLLSIAGQTYKNFEAILIDDGSDDGSFDIARSFAESDSRFLLIHQENGGVSKARNVGIAKASGEYLMFIDGDDYVDQNFCLDALKSVRNSKCDIGIFDYSIVYGDKQEQSQFNAKPGPLDKEDAMATLIHYNFFVNKIFKAELFENILFPVGKKYEDVFTLYKVFQKANSFFYLDKILYYYVQRIGSTVHSFNSQSMRDSFVSYLELNNFFKEKYPKLSPKMNQGLLERAVYFLAYNNDPTSSWLPVAREKLRSLNISNSMQTKWKVVIMMYRLLPKLTIKVFRNYVIR